MQIDTSRERTLIQAVLGPTNTGKTHLAMERMLAHASGVIGFPLRLLARENYERAVKVKGAGQVALVTGEEKIIPAGAKYFLTTTESMPQTYGEGRRFDFAAIDEIQMCADADRGHIFTDRLLHYRGTRETLFLGADTIKGLIGQLVKDVEFVSRPRLSTLRYTGYKKLTRLKARSCIVAFSANDVYAIAELIRRQSGGAAIVMGALSPRTRNAQVDMFQSGDVDYLVATDAVGMGLNMDVDHVALAATRKFDGRMMRDLNAAELAQIAGRAGRHLNDGTFGTTGDVTGLGASAVEHIQEHKFQALTHIFWRNDQLDFASTKRLKQSLSQRPEHAVLRRAREAEDERALDYLLADETVAARTATADKVQLLWDVARVPDFRKIHTDEHPQLLARIFDHLSGSNERIPADWMDERVKRVEHTDGDIDTLMARIAAVRTWTYVAHQSAWLDDPLAWQERTRAAEDKLSDTLHERLTQRFVDQRTSLLAKTLKADAPLSAALHDDGNLVVEGHHLGTLSGFRFVPTPSETSLAAKVLGSAAHSVLGDKIAERLNVLDADADQAFTFDADGTVLWRGEAIARFTKGPSLLHPIVKVLPSDLLNAGQKDKIETRLALWAKDLIHDRLGLLLVAAEAPLNGVARGLVFQLTESLGALPRHEADGEIRSLSKEDRQTLRKLGIRIGRHLVYIPQLLRPAAVEMSVLLWAVFEDVERLSPPPAGRVSLKREKHEPEGWLRAAGFRPAGNVFVRADMLERMAELAWKKLEDAKGPFEASTDFLSLAGCCADDLPGIFKSLGFVPAAEEGKWMLRPRVRKARVDKNQANHAQVNHTQVNHAQAPSHGPAQPGATTNETSGKTAGQKSGAPQAKGHGKKHGHKPESRPPKAATPRPVKIDPDSPFAVLQNLKFKS